MHVRKISLVFPCYNESETIPELYKRLVELAKELHPYEFQFLFVNDGSTDTTASMLNDLAKADKRVNVLHLAGNRGHQIAITAGLDFAAGDVIVTIDADLQDPPELLKEFLRKIEEGYDVVHAQRRTRTGETAFKILTARLFYWLMRRFSGFALIENCGDFRAFTRPVLMAARRFREQHRFLRGMFVLVGFKQAVIQYDRDARYAGQTKYPVRKMVHFAINAILGFSSIPIQIIMLLAMILWGSSLIYLVVALIAHFVYNATMPGWTSTVVLLTFFSGLNLFCLGMIGSYVGRIFEQGQRRPLYWIADTRNIEAAALRDLADIPEVAVSQQILDAQSDSKK
jgi:dolichol-phosphate mannosyltransferase